MLFWDHCHSANLTQINITFSYNYSFPNFLQAFDKKNNWILIFGWDLMFAIIAPWHVPQTWQFKAISDLINFVHFEITESICQKSPTKTTVTPPKKPFVSRYLWQCNPGPQIQFGETLIPDYQPTILPFLYSILDKPIYFCLKDNNNDDYF